MGKHTCLHFNQSYKTQREHSVTLVTKVDTRCNVTTSHANEIMTLYKLTTEGTGTYSHFGQRSSDMSRLAYCCCIAVIACGIVLFHMARASSRLTSVHVKTYQNNSECEVLQRVYRSAGRSHMLKKRICVHTPRRLQWIVIDCKRNLQQRQRRLYKKCCRCTSYQSTRTF